MSKEKDSDCFDLFAWLIHKEVECYINEHMDDYEINKETSSSGTDGIELCKTDKPSR